VVAGISQSGETADTLAVIRDLKRKGIKTLAISNVRGSTLAREADAVFYTAAGPEIGVAATKTFISQLMVLLCFAGALNEDQKQGQLFEEMLKLPHLMKSFLESPEFLNQVRRIAKKASDSKGFFFMGRGFSFPIALEGALKLKEIAYVHAEGYAAGELKHGPIAMLDEAMTVIVLAPQDAWRDKTVSNLEEVKARGAKVISIGNQGDEKLRSISDEMIEIPVLTEDSLLPFLMTIVVQLISYELALIKGTDVDKPRNLAKSVTVE
jgi:glucosamine--fructose-6-phosphate aminotransferase (isomerizing)